MTQVVPTSAEVNAIGGDNALDACLRHACSPVILWTTNPLLQ